MATRARKAVWGWMLFDWASQPYATLLLTFIFAPYFTASVARDPAAGQALWGYTNAAAGVVLALGAPLLGALADAAGPRKPLIAVFSLLVVAGASLLWVATPGMADPTLVLAAFAIGLIGVEGATVLVNAMLPDIAPRGENGRISGTGWAVGYVGGLVALAVMLALLVARPETGLTLAGIAPVLGLDPALREGDRAAGPLTALWYAVFVIPLFLWVPDRPRRRTVQPVFGAAIRALGATVRSLPRRPGLAGFLGASMLYRDALNGLFAFGGIYAAGVLGWSLTAIGLFGILAAATGAAGAWVGGVADQRFGPRPVIGVSVVILALVCAVLAGTGRMAVLGLPQAPGASLPDIVFATSGAMIGAAGGALQAASRTLLIHRAEPGQMAEAFGLYALTGRATAFLAPLSIALITDITGSQRAGIVPLGLLFLAGFALLYLIPGGNAEARGTDAATPSPDPDAFPDAARPDPG